MPDMKRDHPQTQPKLLVEVPRYLRLHHYSIHTERSYIEWIVRFGLLSSGIPDRILPHTSRCG
ncbi:MAG: hypothetical protein CVU57_18450 [Deltaproteobacteria bacterium HGW-Deltaproteobacteria-15]|nr:MAG: hypothetical protein CVU57_18450 [Deltaproteobacteria bacterium HGW-Deltaproteobacteria-15]